MYSYGISVTSSFSSLDEHKKKLVFRRNYFVIADNGGKSQTSQTWNALARQMIYNCIYSSQQPTAYNKHGKYADGYRARLPQTLITLVLQLLLGPLNATQRGRWLAARRTTHRPPWWWPELRFDLVVSRSSPDNVPTSKSDSSDNLCRPPSFSFVDTSLLPIDLFGAAMYLAVATSSSWSGVRPTSSRLPQTRIVLPAHARRSAAGGTPWRFPQTRTVFWCQLRLFVSSSSSSWSSKVVRFPHTLTRFFLQLRLLLFSRCSRCWLRLADVSWAVFGSSSCCSGTEWA